MPQIPRDTSLESTVALLLDPYGFISKRCRRYGSDLFEARILLRRTLCMTGPEAARLFYDPDRFVRRGAAPGRVQKTLFGVGGVQGLDDETHRHRKRMFLSLMTPGQIGRLAEVTTDGWQACVRKWSAMDRVVLYDEHQELLNVLRPTVAVSVYVTFVAHALHQYPECRRKLEAGEEGYSERFVQEVRRFYPFFPSVMARVRRDFEWKGYPFPRGRRVILDLYGTNPDARTWDAPEEFRPERFRGWDGSPFNFIPQGGGDPGVSHRCPGEGIATELMKVALSFLAGRLSYDVPEQDLRINASRLPALPRSRFVIRNVRAPG